MSKFYPGDLVEVVKAFDITTVSGKQFLILKGQNITIGRTDMAEGDEESVEFLNVKVVENDSGEYILKDIASLYFALADSLRYVDVKDYLVIVERFKEPYKVGEMFLSKLTNREFAITEILLDQWDSRYVLNDNASFSLDELQSDFTQVFEIPDIVEDEKEHECSDPIAALLQELLEKIKKLNKMLQERLS